ncbi:10132_t:CDS:1 [Paraglomus brasilianum]|uniref:10132_t:CDS:1 n=1 Tax=Paraglomus brasilianum TaxID=144538 RepID=A0A9N9FTB6_9GLOM|nr:10132_t:CDS:1 [Paraglomus brasilianum]
MYLKSTHSRLVDGGHQWEVTLFCSAEANTIASVDIYPKGRTSKVLPNDAKPAPTAYTMTYSSSRNEDPPERFTAEITFRAGGKKTVTVPANMATDRKRRRPDGSVDDEAVEMENQPSSPPNEENIKKKRSKGCFVWFTRRKNKNKDDMDEKRTGEEDDAPKGCCFCFCR